MSPNLPRRNLVRFLSPQPPPKPELSEVLFVDREDELQSAIEKVEMALQDAPCRMMSVVGLARVGKSHFLDRLVRRVSSNFNVTTEINIAGGGDHLPILRQILRDFFARLQQFVIEEGVGAEAGESVLAPIEEQLREFRPAIDGNSMKKMISRSRSQSNIIQKLGSAKLSANLKNFFARLSPIDVAAEVAGSVSKSDQLSETETSGGEYSVAPFGATDLCDLIRATHELVFQAYNEQSTKLGSGAASVQGDRPGFAALIVLDDFDMLARRPDGSLNPQPLLESLHALAQQEGLYVLSTVREDSYLRHKEIIYPVTFIAPFAEDALLLAIFQKHKEQFNENEDPFSDGFVVEVAKRSQGRIGVFIRFLYDVYSRTPNKTQLAKMSFAEYLKQKWSDIMKQVPQVAALMNKAAMDDGGQILAPDIVKLRQSSVALQFLVEDYSSEDNMMVDPVLASYLRDASGPQ